MDLDIKHNYLRKKLDLLGYNQVLPSSAISLVSTILEDFIKTAEELRQSKNDIEILLKEKSAWELQTEPYKCDNSKLLMENNRLKLEIINNAKEIRLENANLKRKLRNLEIEKNQLEEKCAQLNSTIFHNAKRNLKVTHEKPFISTVRSDTVIPSKEFLESVKDRCHLHCPGMSKKSGLFRDLEKVRSDLKHSEDVIEILQKNEEEKDREIQRLNCLFAGGRPPTALVKDCCYKDVSKIAEDVGKLQRDKIDLQAKLTESRERQEKLLTKLNHAKKKNADLEAYINEIGDAALFVEREANLKLKDQKQKINELKESLSKTSQQCLHHELKNLKKTLKEKISSEEKLIFEVEYLKSKLKDQDREMSAKQSEFLAELIKERDSYRDKCELLMGRPGEMFLGAKDNFEIGKMFHQLKDKEHHIAKLKQEISSLKLEIERFTHDKRSYHSASVTNTIQRIEREKNCLVEQIANLKMENDALNENIRILNDSKMHDSKKLLELEEKYVQLQCEYEELEISKTPAISTIRKLREENCELQMKLKSADDDYKKLESSYHQLQFLNKQTSDVLMDCQSQLEFSRCQLHECESQISCLSKSNEKLQMDLDKIAEELRILRTSKCNAEREKDYYMMSLDKKNEKLHCIESQVECLNQLRDDNRLLKMKNDELTCELNRAETLLCESKNENQCLNKQLDTTKHHLTNAVHENGRMADELSAITAELNVTKKCLTESQKESENIRTKLQSYIHEIERIDGLIAIKDNERKMALLQHKDLECCNMKLQEKFHSLDQESHESRKQIVEYQQQIKILKEQVRDRELDIETLEKQIIDLTTEIDILRSTNERMQRDLDANKDLCDKLDIQREKLEAELMEYRLATKDLCEKNEKLKENIQILREGGTETHISASYHPTM